MNNILIITTRSGYRNSPGSIESSLTINSNNNKTIVIGDDVYFLIYKTTNNINGKIYIGMHQTDDKFDSYLGSGLALKRAIKKYGKESFSKEILFECSSYDEMVEKEKEIITKDFCLREDTYNLGPGGKGGLIWIENPMKGKEQSEKQKASARESMIKMNSDPDVIAKRNLNYKNGMLGKHHSEETKKKMSGPRKKV